MRLLLNVMLLNVIMVLAFTALPAYAQDEASAAIADKMAHGGKDTATAYSNRNNTQQVVKLPGCEFEIAFPGEPDTAHRCDPDNPANCSKVLTFTKVYDLNATLTINVTCNPAEDGMYDRYSLDVMKTTLEAMVGKGALENFESDAVEEKGYKQAILVGSGKSGEHDRLYSAQLWIGQSSVFTVEGEILGYGGPEADKLFSDVMTSVAYVSAENLDKSGDKPAPEGKDAQKD